MSPGGSVLRACVVLEDCQWALQRYSESMSGEPLRVNWIAIVTLLRAVGHVLAKIDASEDPVLADVVKNKWNEWKTSALFAEFIEGERNTVVKQYEFGFERTFVAAEPPAGQAGVVMTVDLLSVRGGPLPPQELPGLQSLIKDGPYKGQAEKRVAQEAIDWWRDQLYDVEKLVAEKKAQTR